MRLLALLGLVVVGALGVIAGCAGSDDETAGTVDTTTTTAGTATETTVTGTTTDGIDPLEGASTNPVEADAVVSETALLERVAVGRHEGFDRVVFQFRNGVPGYRVGYIQPPIREDGSGNRVDVEGDAYAEVRMELASGFDVATGEGELVYTGPRRLTGSGTSVIREVVRTGDFEAVLTWVVGISDRVDFRVTVLDNPARIVVDFRNH
jgi:hypothetical protein